MRLSYSTPLTKVLLLQDYCASKFGAVGFHESLTHELLAENMDGIKTTLVCPYIVDTGMFAGCEIRSDFTFDLWVRWGIGLLRFHVFFCHVGYRLFLTFMDIPILSNF